MLKCSSVVFAPPDASDVPFVALATNAKLIVRIQIFLAEDQLSGLTDGSLSNVWRLSLFLSLLTDSVSSFSGMLAILGELSNARQQAGNAGD